ncbi:MAG: hypothetical protein HOF34_11110, partial [Rhodospirillaceae bacterium]|nr:hypothetical protein [Rhodospirillaceae bacterium]
MASACNFQSRIFLFVSLVAVSLFSFDSLHAQEKAPLPGYVIEEFGKPPAVPVGPLSEQLQSAVTVAFVDSMAQSDWQEEQTIALGEIVTSKDPRIAWLIADMMRFITSRRFNKELADAASALLGIEPPTRDHWGVITDHLIAWDIPAPPDYLPVKRAIFTTLVPGWERIFVEGDIDWRHVSWGGVLIDDRAYDTTDARCN